MSIKTYNAPTSDYNIIYYGSYGINKIKSLITYSFGGKFEANEIIKGIYLGNIDSCYDYDELKKLKITHIISVIEGFEPPYPDKFNYFIINALDTLNTELKDCFELTNKFIEDALDNDGKVLIHCMAGRSRSVTILGAYLIKTFGTDVKNALGSIKARRQIIEPNQNFINQLDSYYKELYKEYL
jgi:protein-tyrosine phosphatase